MQQFFFSESKSFGSRVLQLFNFIHPASVALWNLRWQVQGFVEAAPLATDAEISGRFSGGSGIKANNLKAIFTKTSWDDQLGQFSQIVGSNMIALFEGWAEELLPKFGPARLAKSVQFPSRGTFGNTSSKGVRDALQDIHAAGLSAEMKAAFYPVYSASAKYSLIQLDPLLALYRYHKEVRNSFMHRGGVADSKAEAAWLAASNLTRSDIGGKSTPYLTPIIDGQPIAYPIKEAIQLADVIIRIVHTIDAELSYTNQAELYFIDAWKAKNGALRLQDLPGDSSRREKRIAQICRKVGFVTPADLAAATGVAKRAGLLP
ncbi:hypothetical protein ACIO93_24630 [Streptomyces sp. NPDC087903]|uniref:hypothetical protein n=1 Tax=Streptomyces sp. NPDC087903 TaxID=3365819 RepID=UPI0038285522